MPPPESADSVELPDATTLPPTTSDFSRQASPPAEAGAPGREGSLPVIPGYEILGTLGRGAMGVVYQARQIGLERLVALKMILSGQHAGENERRRFVNEAQAVARLRHPNIVQIHHIGEHAGLPYVTLEYCNAGTLAARLNGTPLPQGDAAEVVRILAEAIQAAHDAGIIHRDLKPANVLLHSVQSAECRVQNKEKSALSSHSALCTLHSALIPKISDFGLAKKLDESGQTATGVILGTPSYMPPEQAVGRSENHGPLVDVYSLGAILYECLAGRPPFKGATALETVVAVVETEPVPPAQLNPKSPRDLETICMKCLQKSPAKRYSSAGALAEDLRRFQAGEPIRARPVGWLERAGKWARKRPAAAALGGVLVLLAGSAIAAGFWYQQFQFDQAREQGRLEIRKSGVEADIRAAVEEIESRRREVQDKLANPLDVSELNNDLDGWKVTLDQIQAVWKRADRLVASNSDIVSEDLVSRVRALGEQLSADESDWRLAKELDDIRLNDFRMVQNKVDRSEAGRKLHSVFARLGLDFSTDEPAQIAARICHKPMRFVLVAALDYWASVIRDPRILPRLLETSRRADPHPWRDQIRDLDTWANKKKLNQLVKKVVIAEHSPQFLGIVAVRQGTAGSNSSALLTGAIRHYPRDFWLNFFQATSLKTGQAQIECYRSCLILRPRSPIAHNNIGNSLTFMGDLKGAIFHLEKAIEYDPHFAGAHLNLGNALRQKKDLKGAIFHFKKAVELDPKYAGAHVNLGAALRENKDLKPAIEHCRKGVSLAPHEVMAQANLAECLREVGDLKGAIHHFRIAVKLDPDDAGRHSRLALALSENNNLQGAIAHFKKSIDLNPNIAEIHSTLGNLLRRKKDLKGAIHHHRMAIKLKPRSAGMHHNLANALRDNKEWNSAIAHFKKAIEIDPDFLLAKQELITVYVNHALIIANKKDYSTAISSFQEALKLESKHPIIHFHFANVLRDNKDLDRAMVHYGKAIELNPRYAAAQVQLANLCLSYKKQFAAAARFYRSAFQKSPHLANDSAKALRFRAARAAVLAAAGQGKDAKPLNDSERIDWRRQARDWLSADLTLHGGVIQAGKPGLLAAKEALTRWRNNPDLATVRDKQLLAKLPEEEQKAWQALWADLEDALQQAARQLEKQAPS